MVRGVLSCVCLLAVAAVAQDRHFPAALGAGVPPLGPTFPQHGAPQAAPIAPVRDYRSPAYWGGYGAYPAVYGYPTVPAPPATSVVVVEPLPAPVAPLPPPAPIRSAIQEVNPPPTTEPPAFFAIALREGAPLTAAAVWVQGSDLRYVDAEGTNRRIPLSAVDRKATREMNQARHLNLQLPPAQ